MSESSHQAVPKLLTVKQFLAVHPWCSNGGLRAQIFMARSNGMNEIGVIVRCGRKVLIDEMRYFRWLELNGRGER